MTVSVRIITAALAAAAASAVAAGVAGCSSESETREATARAATGSRPARLHATARHAFVRQNGAPVALNGVNVVPVWADSPGRTWGQARYDSIARKGFDSVRFVLYWDDFEPRRGAFDPRALSTLDTAVARAKAAGLYVVLDMIHLWGTGGLRDVPGWALSGDSVATVRQNAGPYVRMLARRYRDVPTVAAYDPVNEPHRWPIDQNAVLRMYDRVIGAIREVDPAKVVMVQPSYGATSMAGACADLANLKHRRNVVFSIHAYFAGGDDDGFGPDCRQTGRYTWDPKVGYDTADPAPLRAHLRSYLDTLAPQGIPLYVGEFGIGRLAPNRDRWIRDMVGLLDEFGLGRAWWEYWTEANDGAFSATYSDGGWRPFTSLLVAEAGSAPPAPAPAPDPAGDPVVMAAGDFQGHSGAGGRAGDVAAVMRAAEPDVVLGLGDYQYQYGTLAALQGGFDRNFGALKPRFRPTAGPTHDVAGASDSNGGYVQYWMRAPFQPYSFDLGSWHVVQLPSAAYRYGVDTAGVLSWLEADLTTSTKPCTLAFWHEPYWSRPTTVHSRTTAVRPWVQALYDHGAEVILSGHQHNYQRFAPQAPDDRLDQSRGIREFIVGTGGIGTYDFTGTAPNVEASDATTYGALKLTLRERGYDWSFERATGGSFSDTGSGSCH
jgi:Cellulase (glycosyl hydrolase family 5)/Calcineurin-like phosphoesterase